MYPPPHSKLCKNSTKYSDDCYHRISAATKAKLADNERRHATRVFDVCDTIRPPGESVGVCVAACERSRRLHFGYQQLLSHQAICSA